MPILTSLQSSWAIFCPPVWTAATPVPTLPQARTPTLSLFLLPLLTLGAVVKDSFMTGPLSSVWCPWIQVCFRTQNYSTSGRWDSAYISYNIYPSLADTGQNTWTSLQKNLWASARSGRKKEHTYSPASSSQVLLSDTFGTNLKTNKQDLFKCSFGFQNYRQGMVNLHEEYSSEENKMWNQGLIVVVPIPISISRTPSLRVTC